MRTLIPCAGFGTRLGLRPDQSKEMMKYKGERLIDRWLDICPNPLIITRAEKTDLIEHCRNRCVATQIIEPVGEWMDTVLASKDLWAERNLLVLPDTDFEDRERVIRAVEMNLRASASLVVGTHPVLDPKNWGVIRNEYFIEKPLEYAFGPHKAWGILGFDREIGESLFQAMGVRSAYHLPEDISFIGLKDFKDLTRGPGMVE